MTQVFRVSLAAASAGDCRGQRWKQEGQRGSCGIASDRDDGGLEDGAAAAGPHLSTYQVPSHPLAPLTRFILLLLPWKAQLAIPVCLFTSTVDTLGTSDFAPQKAGPIDSFLLKVLFHSQQRGQSD